MYDQLLFEMPRLIHRRIAVIDMEDEEGNFYVLSPPAGDSGCSKPPIGVVFNRGHARAYHLKPMTLNGLKKLRTRPGKATSSVAARSRPLPTLRPAACTFSPVVVARYLRGPPHDT